MDKDKKRALDPDDVLSPSEYMRTEHPHLFSDTPFSEIPILPKAILEFHLSTLTSRKQELLFEDFCLKIAKAELHPNLRPQTGPIGGGDSHVDSSTIPISEEISERAYFVSPVKASSDSVALAFSCKKDWRTKVRDDVTKIAELKRDFDKVYFFTNQSAKDKTRALIEDELQEKFGFEVYILDITWLIQSVIEHKREHIAIESLNIEIGEFSKPPLGDQDYQRTQELEGLLEKLRNIGSYEGNDYLIVKDYLRAAYLSRSLEKPRHETEGLYQRAFDLSKSIGSRNLIIESGYDYAWTAYWWYEDTNKLLIVLKDLVPLLDEVDYADDLLNYSNLFTLAFIEMQKGSIKPEEFDYRKSFDRFIEVCKKLAEEKYRPNNALNAETVLHLANLHEHIHDEEEVNSIFLKIKGCIERSEGLGEYPLDGHLYTLNRLGRFIGHYSGYGELFEIMTSASKAYYSEIEEGKLLYDRGIQLYNGGDLHGALECLHKAAFQLNKSMTRSLSMQSTLACSDIYSDLKLYWAARIEALISAHNSLKHIDKIYENPALGIYSAKRLAWIELRLGRVVQFLTWIYLCKIIFNGFKPDLQHPERLKEELDFIDTCLGFIILNSSDADFGTLYELRYTFDSLGLYNSYYCALYVNDHVNEIFDELNESREITIDQIHAFYENYKNNEELSEYMASTSVINFDNFELATGIQNVLFKVVHDGTFGTILGAEEILACLESAMFSARWENLAIVDEEVHIYVKENENGSVPPNMECNYVKEILTYTITWKKGMIENLKLYDRKELKDFYFYLTLHIITDITIDPIDDIKKEFDHIKQQGYLDKMLAAIPSAILLLDIIERENYELSFWCESPTTSEI